MRKLLAAMMSTAAFGLAGCGGGSGGTGGVIPVPAPPAKLSVSYPGTSLIKLRSGPDGWVAMSEKPHGFMDVNVMQRQLEMSDAAGHHARNWQVPAGWTLVDFTLHGSREITAILSNGTALRLDRLDSKGGQLSTQLVRDPAVAHDPYYGAENEVRDRTTMAPSKTLDAVRVDAIGNDVGIVLRAGGNSVVAYRYNYANGIFTQRWRTLVEPGIPLDGLRPTGGSYDPFDGLENHWRVYMDTDARGRMAVAVLVSQRAELSAVHARHFNDALPAAFVDGVLLTILDEHGRRAPSLAIDNHQKSELHAIRWAGDAVLLAGRVRSSRSPAGDGWDGYIARVDTTARGHAYHLVDVDRGDVIFDLFPLNPTTILLAGATGYTQNPGGESVSDSSAVLLARLNTTTGAVTRIAAQSGPRGNQIRSMSPYGSRWLFGGMQNVPGTHSADADTSLLTTDGYVREIDVAE